MQDLTVATAKEAGEKQEYLAALTELLFQMADDDFILAYRGSEWLGLAPHIEEDVAFSSISQDTMGHAVMFYEMLEELGAGRADDLAQLRKPEEFKNAVFVERPNGSGNYKEDPHYDWAYAIARFYAYELFKLVRLESLARSSYQPLAFASKKMLAELRYHLYHWQVWFNQLVNSTEEASMRMTKAMEKVWQDAAGLFDLGPKAKEIVELGLIEDEEVLLQRWLEKARQAFETKVISLGKPQKSEVNGRAGEHTADLVEAVATLSEVYRLNPAANW
ncbi:1,2-phenylacetyl-CoA epoxidase subunit PaaC [Aneurinibacillus terranovensis]|uniref:1,2-phenylacetyl-CoA epoxidase subunit PaaC n=1 Tax=Aneurinibacillus terranovensis TaxID=278991 RepID=UPI00041CCE45|nr:1,2-phenylacetyl-CoA epoxidase subunit PaaC [Aneurinibacillus terranovensis]